MPSESENPKPKKWIKRIDTMILKAADTPSTAIKVLAEALKELARGMDEMEERLKDLEQ